MEHIPGRAQRCLARSQFGDRLNADPRGTARTPELWPGPTSLGASRPWPGPTALTTVSRRRGMRPANAFRRPVAHAADLDWGTPLARGRGDGGRGEVVGVRNTPARAGPTGRLPATPWRCTEHPRSRGADSHRSATVGVPAGAPPLARGRQLVRERGGQGGRSTPARAGPTPPRAGCWCRPAEHPRSRGADANASGSKRGWRGAPPLARGRRLPRRGPGARAGSTPARAGPTVRRTRRASSRREHPRSRGADSGAGHAAPRGWGAPPLARGRRGTRKAGHRPVGSTPARAGPTLAELRC
ncbi:hypothetical protein P3T26_004019 [Streptomyces sp. MAA16]|nr:hypothetical protein [Streptomyces sp. MAA16]